MKQAIITGSTGFIGSAFVRYLIEKGIGVLALGRKNYSTLNTRKKNNLNGAKYISLDMASINLLPKILSDISWTVGEECVFFNLAWGGEDRLSDLNIAAQLRNVGEATTALEVSSSLGCSRFIQVGTMEEAFTKSYLTLDHHVHTYYNRHVIYSVAKLVARQALEAKSFQLGMDFIYVLHSHVMGPDDDKDSFLQVTLLKLMHDEELIFSTGDQIFDVISLEDCAHGYYLICQKGRPGKDYWVGSGDPQKLRIYIERMCALFPSAKERQFGKLAYNDITLDKEIFSIADLTQDTGFQPLMSFEQIILALHSHLATVAPSTPRS